MRNRVGLLFFFLASCLLADSITITVKGPKNQISSVVTVNPAPTITNINCVPGTVLEGDMVSCTIILDRPAPAGGLKLSVLGAPGVDSVIVPAALTGATFSFFAAIPPQVPPPADAAFHPLMMPMRNGPGVGLKTNLFLAMFYYQAHR